MEHGLEKLESLPSEKELIPGAPDERSFEQSMNYIYERKTAIEIAKSAIEREESRGAHYRDDYTEKDPEWRKNIIVDRNGRQYREPTQPSEEVQAALDEGHELDYHHLE